MNDRTLVRQGSTMWQGVMKAWSTIQSGLEQQDPTSWAEIMRQPLFGNRLLTNEQGVQWGTESNTTMSWWPGRNLRSLQNIIRPDGEGWKFFEEQWTLRRTRVTPILYARVRNSIPWDASPEPSPALGQWVAPKEVNGDIKRVFQVTNADPLQATLYHKDQSEKLCCVEQQHLLEAMHVQEVRVVQCREQKRQFSTSTPRRNQTQKTLYGYGAITGCGISSGIRRNGRGGA